MTPPLPALGICGPSGSGKTTLIEQLIPRLSAMGLRVGVIKHHGHRLDIDRPGKDSDRFFRAGADVIMNAPGELAFRSARYAEPRLDQLLPLACRCYDLILIEGYKATDLVEKVWLFGESEAGCPPPADARRVLRRDDDRVVTVLDLIADWLPAVWKAAPLYAGILIGGRSSRMGQPKHLLPVGGRTYLERTVEVMSRHVDRVVLLGQERVPDSCSGLPVLPDAPGHSGPLAGMLAAMQWAPLVSWVFAACDLPLVSDEAVEWLLARRRPGVWAILPRLAGRDHVEPLFAHYDYRAWSLLASCRRPVDLDAVEKVASPQVPEALAAAWTNVNTPDEARAVTSRAG